MKAILIGCGGIGSMLAPVICRMVGNRNVIFVDGDHLETKNLDRQLFSVSQVGENKAGALSQLYPTSGFKQAFYTAGCMEHDADDVLFSCVDNHPARLAVLQASDMFHCAAILAGNETYSSEALLYFPKWYGTDKDPRVIYPEIVTTQTGDPRHAQIGCVEAAQNGNVQRVSANQMAAALAAHLFSVNFKVSGLGREAKAKLPHRISINMTSATMASRG